MKIKIIVGCSGLSFSYAPGEIVDAEKDIAKDLIDGKLAVEFKDEKPKAGAAKNVKT